MKRLRVAVIADYPEEGWASMDLVAEMILTHLHRGHAGEVEAVRVCPPYRHRFGRLPIGRARSHGRRVDRGLNRHIDYPRYLRTLTRREPFDVYHVVDHSYAQLVEALPTGRAVVTCHDLDAFRCLIRPELEPRPRWFLALARRTLRGLRAATAVACISEATHRAILDSALVPEDRLRVVRYGVHPEYLSPTTLEAEAEADRLIGRAEPAEGPLILHVGSTIPRKRIDVLLDVFAGVRAALPGARLIRVGGEFTPEQAEQARRLGLLGAIRVIPFLGDRRTLAALYRRAALVLQPSEAEGFGLPVAEAMAVGTPLLVSEIPVFREVAGDAAVYRRVGDVDSWVVAAVVLLHDHARRNDAWRARSDAGLARSALYRWDAHVAQLVSIYRGLATGH